MASFHSYKTSSGETRWRVAWRVGRKQKSKRGFRTKRQATRWWLDNGGALEDGGETSTPTIKELWPRVMDRHQRWKPSTKYRREQLYRDYIEPVWADVECGQITYLAVQDWATTTLAPKFATPGTPSQIVTCLRFALEEARRAGHIESNPCEGVYITATGESTRRRGGDSDATDAERNTLTEEQVERIISHITVPVYRDAVRLLAACGMRWGEMAGLRAEDVDLQAQTITIRRTVSHVSTGIDPVRRPKTGRTRVIALPTAVLPMMEERVAANPDGWLFPSPRDNTFIGTPGAGLWFGAAVDAARKEDPSIPEGFHPHSLRHTAVSRWLAAGVPMTTVAEQVGHATVATTQRVYAHIMPDSLDRIRDL